jgi:hypothetical protein
MARNDQDVPPIAVLLVSIARDGHIAGEQLMLLEASGTAENRTARPRLGALEPGETVQQKTLVRQ